MAGVSPRIVLMSPQKTRQKIPKRGGNPPSKKNLLMCFKPSDFQFTKLRLVKHDNEVNMYSISFVCVVDSRNCTRPLVLLSESALELK